MAIAETAARKLLHGGAGGTIAQGIADVGGISFSLDGLWQLVTGFFAGILANLLAALAGVVHLLVLPLEALWQWLVITIADAAGTISPGLGGLWHHVTGFFARIFTHLFAALAGVAHLFVLPLEALWQWLRTTVADAAGAISFGLDGLWQLVTGFFPGIFARLFAALAGAAHDLPKKLEELWRWLQAAAAVALPFVLGVAAVLLLVALVWFCGPTLCAVTVGVSRALVSAACLLPPCMQCLTHCTVVTMKAPGAAGRLISRAAFEATPVLYFQILYAAGPVVATTIFCTKTVASLLAAPVAALFRASVGA